MEKKEYKGFNPFGSERYVFNESNTKESVASRESLLSIGIKESIDGISLFQMPCFRPLETILSANYDAVEMLYQNEKNEFQSILGVRKGKLCGLINMLGVLVLPLDYSAIICPINSSKPVFCVSRYSDHKWAAIDIFEKEVIPFGKYVYMWGYDHDKCLVSTKSGSFENRAVIGIDGEVLISPHEYTDIYNFRGKKLFCAIDKDNTRHAISVATLTEFANPHIISSSMRINKNRIVHESSTDNYPYDEPGWGSYDEYGGYNGYDDYTIDSAFDGDPEATWNID